MSAATPPFDVRAVLAYSARNASEISLELGRVFTVLEIDPRGKWFKARRPNAPGTGWLPAAYTRPLTPPSSPPPESVSPAVTSTSSPALSSAPSPSSSSTNPMSSSPQVVATSSASQLPPLPVLEDGTVDVERVPSEWKQVFKAAGVRKKDLLDPAFTARIYDALGIAPTPATPTPTPNTNNNNNNANASVVAAPVVRQRRLTVDILEAILNPAIPQDLAPQLTPPALNPYPTQAQAQAQATPAHYETPAPLPTPAPSRVPPTTRPPQVSPPSAPPPRSSPGPAMGMGMGSSFGATTNTITNSTTSTYPMNQSTVSHSEHTLSDDNTSSYQMRPTSPQPQPHSQPHTAQVPARPPPTSPRTSNFNSPHALHSPAPASLAPLPSTSVTLAPAHSEGLGLMEQTVDAFGRPAVYSNNPNPNTVPSLSGGSSSATPIRDRDRRAARSGEDHLRPSKAPNTATTTSSANPNASNGRFYLTADPFDFDRAEHAWRLRDRALTLSDVVGEHAPKTPAKSKGIFGSASKTPAAASDEERLVWLGEELSTLLNVDDEAKLSSRPLAPRVNVLRALLLLLESVYSRVDDTYASPIRKLARDVQQSAAQSLAQDTRALQHELRNTLTTLRLLPEAAPQSPWPPQGPLPPHLLNPDGTVRATVYADMFRAHSAQELGNLARVKLAFAKELTPLMRICAQQVPDLLRNVFKDLLGSEVLALAQDTQRALQAQLTQTHTRAQSAQQSLGSLLPLLRFTGKAAPSGASASANAPWPSAWPVTAPSLLEGSHPSSSSSSLMLVVASRAELKSVLDAYADYLVTLEQQIIAWRLAVKMLDLLQQLVLEAMPKTARVAPASLLSSITLGAPNTIGPNASAPLSPLSKPQPQPQVPPLPTPIIAPQVQAPVSMPVSIPTQAPAPVPSASASASQSMSDSFAGSGSGERMCAHCGHSVQRSQARFCPACGGSLDDKPRDCLKCYAQCTLKEKFCWQCGTPMGEPTPTLSTVTAVTLPRTTSKPKPLPQPKPKPKISQGEDMRPMSLDEDVAREMDELALLLEGEEADLALAPPSQSQPQAAISSPPVPSPALRFAPQPSQSQSVQKPPPPAPEMESSVLGEYDNLPRDQGATGQPYTSYFGEQTLLASIAELDQLRGKRK